MTIIVRSSGVYFIGNFFIVNSTCKDSARREQYKINLFIFIAEP